MEIDNNNNNNLANNNITSNEYKHIGSNEIIVPEFTKIELNPDVEAEKGKNILLQQIVFKYQITPFVAKKIYELKDNEAECIEYINQVIPNTHDRYPGAYAQELYEIVHNFDPMNPDKNLFKKVVIEPVVEQIPEQVITPESVIEPVVEPEVEPEPVVEPEQEEEEDLDYVPIKTADPDVVVIVTPLRNELVIQIQKDNVINNLNLKVKGGVLELLDLSKNYEPKLTKLFMQAGRLQRKEAKEYASDFMSVLGYMGYEKFEEIAEKSTNNYQVDLTQFCDETIKIEMIEYAVDLVHDGNTKKYIASRVMEKYNLDVKDSKFVVESAETVKESYILAVNPRFFFVDDKMKIIKCPISYTVKFVNLGISKQLGIMEERIFTFIRMEFTSTKEL